MCVFLGSLFKFYVDVINSGYVIVYGLGFCYGIVNESVEFIIVIKDVGVGKDLFTNCYYRNLVIIKWGRRKKR